MSFHIKLVTLFFSSLLLFIQFLFYFIFRTGSPFINHFFFTNQKSVIVQKNLFVTFFSFQSLSADYVFNYLFLIFHHHHNNYHDYHFHYHHHWLSCSLVLYSLFSHYITITITAIIITIIIIIPDLLLSIKINHVWFSENISKAFADRHV